MAALLAAPIAHAQDITTGLVGHWKLDEVSGTTAADSVGSNDGTMQSGLDAGNDNTAGIIGNALDFDDASDHYVDMGDVLNMGTNDWTIASWVKYQDTDGGFMIAKDRGFQGGYASAVTWDEKFMCRFKEDAIADVRVETAASYVQTNQWYHIACVYDRDGDLTLYIDGVQAANSDISVGDGINRTDTIPLRLGRRDQAGDFEELDAEIDDARIYNRALTADDIAVLASGTAPGGMRYNDETEGIEYHSGYDWVHAGLGSYSANGVTFDGTSDYVSGTLSGLSDTKKWSGSFWFRLNNLSNTDREIFDTDGQGDISFNWKGASSDRIIIYAQNASPAAVLNIQSSAINDTDWHHVMFSVDLSDTSKRHIYVDGVSDLSNIVTYTDDFMDFTNPTTFYVGEEQNGTGTFNGDLADVWVAFNTYIDLSVQGNREKFLSANGMPMYLGPDCSMPTGVSPDICLTGNTDNWHLNKGSLGTGTENGALTDATSDPVDPDITSGLVAHWRLDESSGTTAADDAGSNNGTLFNFPGSVPWQTSGGKRKGSLLFAGEGSNDVVSINDAAALNQSSFTLSAWFKTSGFTSNGSQKVIGKYNNSGGQTEYWMGINQPENSFRCGYANAGFVIAEDQNEAVSLDEWHHGVCTYDSATGTLRAYLNGTLMAEQDDGGTSPHDGTGRLYIGGIDWSNNTSNPQEEFNGEIDDVRIYNRALTASEVIALRNLTGFCTSPAEPGGSIIYNTDENVMQYCNGVDWVAMGPDGVTTGAGCSNPTGATGDIIFNDRFAKLQYCNSDAWVGIGQGRGDYTPNAVAFDGTNDYLTEGSLTTSDDKKGTVSFWFKLDSTSAQKLIHSPNGRFKIDFNDNIADEIEIQGRSSTPTNILSLRTSNLNADTTSWHHIMASWDLSDTNKRHLYLDGVSDLNVTTYIDDIIDYTTSYNIGRKSDGTERWNGGVADFWFDMGTYVDLSNPNIRKKFYNNGPVDLGSDGSRPTGTSPEIFLSGDTVDWHTNDGTGGGFTENGALSDATTTPR